jgi:FixJ family two-component response regulator
MTDSLVQPVVAVVDDDSRVLQSLGSLLESADYAVRLFGSAEAMLESHGLAHFECLISDIDMPGMHGFELLRIVQAQRPDLPVILITGQSNKLDQAAHADAGRYQLLRKPFAANDLLTIIGDSLRGRSTKDPTSAESSRR